MNKSTLSLLVAGTLALAGVAQAQTFDTPTQAGEASTMTNGAPNQLTTNSPYGDGNVALGTTILGAGPVTTTTYGYTLPAPVVDTRVLGAGPVVVYTDPLLVQRPGTTATVTTYGWGMPTWNGAYMSPNSPYYGN